MTLKGLRAERCLWRTWFFRAPSGESGTRCDGPTEPSQAAYALWANRTATAAGTMGEFMSASECSRGGAHRRSAAQDITGLWVSGHPPSGQRVPVTVPGTSTFWCPVTVTSVRKRTL